MSQYQYQPRPITDLEQFFNFRDNWQRIITAENPAPLLDTCFASAGNGKRMNYVFVPTDYINDLINTPNTTHIQAVFVVAPPLSQEASSAEPAPLFSVVLIPIDEYGNPTSATYYLAGVADLPARVGTPPMLITDIPITNSKASTWIRNWNNPDLGQLSLDLFKSGEDKQNRALRGYTYTTADFRDALGDGQGPAAEKVLWLNFALYSDTPQQFAISLCLNNAPADNTPKPGYSGEIDFTNAQHFFDLSRPCPPCCYVSMPIPLPQLSA